MNNRELIKLEKLSNKYNETNIPLYVSYPTERYWKSPVTQIDFFNDLAQVDDPHLYFHFPYCKNLCYYCCCYKENAEDETKYDRYLDYLVKEIDLKLSQNGKKGIKTKHMHWGGGTPTLMSVPQISKIAGAIKDRIDFIYKEDTVISVESYPDPEVLTRDKIRLFKEAGFTAISFGIQDFDSHIQKVINRNNKPETAKSIINTAKEIGLEIHIDLCYGLPFQGINEIERTARLICEISPDRIAVFPYAHYPIFFPNQRAIPNSSIPNSFVKVLLSMKAEEIFTGYGYEKIGIDHYAKPGDSLTRLTKKNKSSRTLMGYTIGDHQNFVSFGNSAVSFFNNRFYQNIFITDNYFKALDKNELPLDYTVGYRLSKDDLIRTRIILIDILTNFNVEKQTLNEIYKIEFDKYFAPELEKLKSYEDDGLLNIEKDRITITELGKHFARHAALVFDTFYSKK